MIISVESVSRETAVQASCLSACLAAVQASASLPLGVDVEHARYISFKYTFWSEKVLYNWEWPSVELCSRVG